MRPILLLNLLLLLASAVPAVAATRGLPSGPEFAATGKNPARFHVRADGSESMDHKFNLTMTRAETARLAMNSLLFSLVSANIVGDKIHDRATVTVKGYNDEHETNLLADAAVKAKLRHDDAAEYTLTDLAAMIPDDLPAGEEPVWIEHFVGSGDTPTMQTMHELAESVTGDVKGRSVFLVHLSDGRSSDGEFYPEVHRWATNVIKHGGSPLATNVFISAETPNPLVFPTPQQAKELLASDSHFLEMWESSSEMPDSMARRIETDFPELGIKEGQHRRLTAYGVKDLQQLKAIFKAGSSSAAGF